MAPRSLSQKLKTQIEKTIVVNEGAFTIYVLADFREGYQALLSDNDRIAYCRRWNDVYHPVGRRVSWN